jgi:hypothetical protein
MATNFKITGKGDKSPKSHYVVEREYEKKEHNELVRLEKKLDKHINLPMEKAHKKESQPKAGIPALRK